MEVECSVTLAATVCNFKSLVFASASLTSPPPLLLRGARLVAVFEVRRHERGDALQSKLKRGKFALSTACAA